MRNNNSCQINLRIKILKRNKFKHSDALVNQFYSAFRLFNEKIFENKIEQEVLNELYNISDLTINIANNEGGILLNLSEARMNVALGTDLTQQNDWVGKIIYQ